MKRKWEVVGEIGVDTGMVIASESRNYEIKIEDWMRRTSI